MLNEYFMLLYSDNFAQFNLKKLAKFYHNKNRLLCFMVHAKPTGNIRLGGDGIVDD